MTKTTSKAASKGKIERLKPQATGKETALQRVIAQIEKQYGQGAIMQMDEHLYARIEGIPTGSLSLDLALGGAGIPRGRVAELFGPESSGKTTLALHVIASAQRAGGVAAFIDAEHALDTTWAKRLGVDVSSMLVSQPDTGEQALNITEMLISSNSIDVIVIDSVAALTPKAEIEGDMGDVHVGRQARLMSQAMRKLTSIIGKSKTALAALLRSLESFLLSFINWPTLSTSASEGTLSVAESSSTMSLAFSRQALRPEPVRAVILRTPAEMLSSLIILKPPICPVLSQCVPPQNSREKASSSSFSFAAPIATTRTSLPYFSPNSAIAPSFSASALGITTQVNGRLAAIFSLTKSSTFF